MNINYYKCIFNNKTNYNLIYITKIFFSIIITLCIIINVCDRNSHLAHLIFSLFYMGKYYINTNLAYNYYVQI